MEKRRKHIIGLIIGILALICLTLGLRSCDSTVRLPSFDSNITVDVDDQAKKVDDLIMSIPVPVTLDSEKAINDARKAYESLSNDDKNKVTMLDKLVEYENALKALTPQEELTGGEYLNSLLNGLDLGNLSIADLAKIRLGYEALSDEEKAKFDLPALEKIELSLPNLGDYLNSLLDGISLPVNAQSAGLLSRIRDLFNNLTDDQKAQFDLARFEELENSLNGDFKGYQGVIDMIDAISLPITLDSEDAINNAMNAYNALNVTDKANVSNYAALLDYLNQFNALKNDNNIPATGID